MVTRLELVADKLDGELALRRRELSDINLSAQSSAGNKAATLRRAGHVMAYAHWEGFVKLALTNYIAEVCQQQRVVGDLRGGLRAAMLSTRINVSAAENPFSLAIELVESVRGHTTEKFTLTPESLLKTGNLTSKKFRSMLSICSLDYLDYYATKENFIDEVLCGRRHRIAHGGPQPISADDLSKTINRVLNLCQMVNDQVIEALLYEHYLANS
ncbi:MAE_28990/MAE_18760 family HEPN-like nuclease [Amycolatopsis sp. NPDC021455]|uniref:MAE_28990/MAE_18760 family HEPN-like nuclease n=1 Tax=Amycolatopsis sp. NPDC021455 TaxID=3154901 RepID=UPI0033C6FA9C